MTAERGIFDRHNAHERAHDDDQALTNPAEIMQRLEDIDSDLQSRQLDLARYGEEWTRKKREKAKKWADAYMLSSGKEVTTRKASAILQSEDIGMEEEAKYVAVKSVVDVLQTRATINQSLLKAHGRS